MAKAAPHDDETAEAIDLNLPDDFHVEHGAWDTGELVELIEDVRGPRARILEVLRIADEALPIGAIERNGNLSENTAAYHLQDAGTNLVDLGLVEQAGQRRVVSGNVASTWRLTEDGQAVAEAATTVPGIRGAGEEAEIDPALQSLDDRLDSLRTEVDLLSDHVSDEKEADYVTEDGLTEYVRHYTSDHRNQADEARQTARSNEKRINRIAENIDELRQAVGEREREIDALREENDELENRIKTIEEWLSANVGGGFRAKEPKPWERSEE